MTALILTIFAAILIIGGLVMYIVFQYQTVNRQDQLEFVGIFKKQSLSIVGWLLMIIGAVLAILAYFYNEDTISYLDENSLTLSTSHGLMIYFGILFFGIFALVLCTTLVWILYMKRLQGKTRKIVKIVMICSIVLTCLFFLLFEEGIAPYLQYPLANQILFSSEGVTLVSSRGKASTDGFSISIAFYAIFIILGALLVLYICDYKMYKKYGEHGLLTSTFFIAFPVGIIGARVWYCIGDWYQFADNPISVLYIWDGGLAIMGGAIFGVAAGILWMVYKKCKDERYKKMDYFWVIDMIIPTILIAQAIGRLGNFMNNEVHGNAVSIEYWEWLPTAIKNNMHYSSAGPTLGEDQIYVPLFLIEAIVNLVGYFFIEYGIQNLFGLNKLLKHDYHANGSCIGWYIAWYGATRAVLEPMRYSSYNMGEDGNWSIVSAYVMIGVGLAIVLGFAVVKYLTEKGIITLQWDKYNQKLALEEAGAASNVTEVEEIPSSNEESENKEVVEPNDDASIKDDAPPREESSELETKDSVDQELTESETQDTIVEETTETKETTTTKSSSSTTHKKKKKKRKKK